MPACLPVSRYEEGGHKVCLPACVKVRGHRVCLPACAIARRELGAVSLMAASCEPRECPREHHVRTKRASRECPWECPRELHVRAKR